MIVDLVIRAEADIGEVPGRMKKMEIFYEKYIKSFPSKLKILLVLSLLIVGLEEALLFHLQPLFLFANETGVLIERILLSFVSGIILYFFTSHYPRIKKKINIHSFVHNAFFKIQQISQHLIWTIYENVEKKPPNDLSLVKEEELLKLVSVKVFSKQVFTFDSIEYSDVTDLLSAVQSYVDIYYNMVVPYMDYVDGNVQKDLTSIVDMLVNLINPVQRKKERTAITTNAYVKFVIKLLEYSIKLRF